MIEGFAVWLTGLPCAGKTTLAEALAQELVKRGSSPELLDGDLLRKTISADLGYTDKDRRTHVTRVAERTLTVVEAGQPAIVAVISPHRDIREEAKKKIQPFVEVYVRCPLKVCETRDVKSLYRLARSGTIQNFTGISSPYEPPKNPSVVVDTDIMDVPSCVGKIVGYLERNRIIG